MNYISLDEKSYIGYICRHGNFRPAAMMQRLNSLLNTLTLSHMCMVDASTTTWRYLLMTTHGNTVEMEAIVLYQITLLAQALL